ncbi:MAG: hypothetical protein IPJ41_10280 [Phycisphaerales bacterium]|nr:hypothetical protein [Phycisphaerales bacterium]
MTHAYAMGARPRRAVLPTLSRLAILFAAVLLAPQARADEFVNRVNAYFADVRPDRRSDPIILASLSAMEPPPAGVAKPRQAALVPASSAMWSEAAAWAQKPTQVAVLEALDQVTQETDQRRAMVFAQPYGLAELGSSPEQIKLIAAGLYTDLGDPPLLATARHLYLPRFDDMACLVNVEATRRLAAGDAAGALDVLTDWVYFARQIADREFYAEKSWAFEAMVGGIERIRDVTYQDFRGGKTLTADQLKTVIDRLQDERALLTISKIQLPRADFEGASQLIASLIAPRGRVKPELFSPTMARLASTQRPLRLFGEAARWDSVAAIHVDWYGANEALDALRSDYEYRWTHSRFDENVSQPFVVERYRSPVVRDAVAIVTRSVPDMRELFKLRLELTVELAGTRDSMGLVGFYAENRAYPLDLSAIRPRFVTELEGDPFAAPGAGGRQPPLIFFVPIRDTKDRFPPRATIPPHEISVIVADAPNVAIALRDDQFVLYSVGADGSKQWADEAQNTTDAPAGRDYLLWPPVLSIVRETLVQSGDLK